MKNLRRQNLQRQIKSLIPIVERCLPVAEEMTKTQEEFGTLPEDLEYLKRQIEAFGRDESSIVLNRSPSFIQQESEIELNLDVLITNLEETFLRLAIVKHKIDDLIVLRERLEALQEERIDCLTPERIYELIEIQRQKTQVCDRNKTSTTGDRFAKLRQNFANYRHKNLVLCGVFVISSLLGWSAFNYSSTNVGETESNFTEKVDPQTQTQ